MRSLPLIALAVLTCLSGCGAPAAKVVHYVPLETPGGRMCADQCAEAKDYCMANCDVGLRLCSNQVQTQAIQDYDKYTRAQFMAHKPITLTASDFEHMQPCTDTRKSCAEDCESDHQSCYKTCGGTVETQTSCQFLCF